MHDAYDRGYACLDIEYTYPEDSGMYSVVVRNRSGDVQANPVRIRLAFMFTQDMPLFISHMVDCLFKSLLPFIKISGMSSF